MPLNHRIVIILCVRWDDVVPAHKCVAYAVESSRLWLTCLSQSLGETASNKSIIPLLYLPLR